MAKSVTVRPAPLETYAPALFADSREREYRSQALGIHISRGRCLDMELEDGRLAHTETLRRRFVEQQSETNLRKKIYSKARARQGASKITSHVFRGYLMLTGSLQFYVHACKLAVPALRT